MVKTDQIGPRISSHLKEVFKNHLEREKGGYKGPLGDEVEQALELWLAVYYLNNKKAKEDVPQADKEVITRSVENHAYKIRQAASELESTSDNAEDPISWDQVDQQNESEVEEDAEIIKAAKTILEHYDPSEDEN